MAPVHAPDDLRERRTLTAANVSSGHGEIATSPRERAKRNRLRDRLRKRSRCFEDARERSVRPGKQPRRK